MKKTDSNTLFFGNSVDTSMRFGQIGKFIEHVDGFFKREVEWFRNEAHPDLEIEFVPLFAQELPPVLYTSSIITLVSIMEQELRGISTALKSELGLGLSLNHLSGSLIERFNRYVLQVALLDVQISEEDWSDIASIYELRNCLVHSGGSLGDFSKKSLVQQFCKKQKIKIDGDFIELSFDDVKTILGMVVRFMDGIYNATLQRFPGQYKPIRIKK